MKIKETPSRIVFKLANTIILCILAFACLIPLWHVLMASFSDPALMTQHTGIIFWPLSSATTKFITFKGYEIVFRNNSLLRGYANTIYYVCVGTSISVTFSSLAAYCMSRKKTIWLKYLTILMTFTMFFNGGLIPTYMVNKKLGLIDKRWIMVINAALSFYNIIIIRTSFASLPASLEESASLDGAGHITILTKIILPLSKATIAVIALFYAVMKWNEYLSAMIYLQTRKLFPLQVILREILIDATMTDINFDDATEGQDYKQLVKYCVIIVATVPILCVYPFVQKYFVKGVMIGSIKG
jgi:putative aldouronate transport system permease protein